jgi:hypothetical protein
MLTVQYARAVPEVKFNAVEPGITATELGGGDPGSHPGRPAEISAQVVIRLATIGVNSAPAPSRKTTENSNGERDDRSRESGVPVDQLITSTSSPDVEQRPMRHAE